MKKWFRGMTVLLVMIFLSGCNAIGDKSTSMSAIYGAMAVLTLLLFIGYCCLVRKKETLFLLLFTSVFVVNVGYFLLSISTTLEAALWANRIAYLGSVLLPVSMLMIIMNVSRHKYKKWLPALLFATSLVVFLVAASPGYLDIYYKEVSIETINGVTVLNKVYGPWHDLYLFYLVCYFTAIVVVTIHAIVKKRLASKVHAAILAVTVFVNIGVWLLEQLVKIDFEFLSVSYAISELFLLGLYLMMQEADKPSAAGDSAEIAIANTAAVSAEITDDQQPDTSQVFATRCKYFAASLPTLTRTERLVYNFYVEGKTTKEIMQILNIKENTLKYHNKNIYGKLGVSSRKQLMEIARALEAEKDQEE